MLPCLFHCCDAVPCKPFCFWLSHVMASSTSAKDSNSIEIAPFSKCFLNTILPTLSILLLFTSKKKIRFFLTARLPSPRMVSLANPGASADMRLTPSVISALTFEMSFSSNYSLFLHSFSARVVSKSTSLRPVSKTVLCAPSSKKYSLLPLFQVGESNPALVEHLLFGI